MLKAGIVLTILLVAAPAIARSHTDPAPVTACPQCPLSPQVLTVDPGPVPAIENFWGSQFDWAYMLAMYQQNRDIQLIAAMGNELSCDPTMREFSRKIILERGDMNTNLKNWYFIYFDRIMPNPPPRRAEALVCMLRGLSPAEFNCTYSAVMIGLLRQSQDAADWAIDKSTILELRDQARVTYRTNQNEADAFTRWRQTGSLGLRRK